MISTQPKNALDTAGLFEGPISLFALDPEPVKSKKESIITGVTAITWKSVTDVMSVFDVVEACNPASRAKPPRKGPTAEGASEKDDLASDAHLRLGGLQCFEKGPQTVALWPPACVRMVFVHVHGVGQKIRK